MWDLSPSLVRYGDLEQPSSVLDAIKALKVQAERETIRRCQRNAPHTVPW
jgi:NADH dehydrogenase (ubiquinone) Fe-S protein 1